MTKIQQYQQLLIPNMVYSPELLITLLEQVLSEKRYAHVIRVLNTAKILANKFQVSKKEQDQIIQAVLFHDLAKGMKDEELFEYAEIYSIYLGDVPAPIYHAIVGAWMMEYFFDINDKKVLEAVYYHTTGYINFLTNQIGAILFIADYLEPARSFEKLHIEIHIPSNIKLALLEIVKDKISYVIQRNRVIDCKSVTFYHGLLKEQGDN
ncbi:MAG: bis(5'-nucleosyl)-tetraphosphatase (symmetrical) YqeK [Spirochaetota bacterium]|nr:bis(5'-nucleosyl)-tetraphosphatase (symmetrical) YqeK [Spirochaetota bacterium]